MDIRELRALVEEEMGLCDAAAELVPGVDLEAWADDWPALADLMEEKS